MISLAGRHRQSIRVTSVRMHRKTDPPSRLILTEYRSEKTPIEGSGCPKSDTAPRPASARGQVMAAGNKTRPTAHGRAVDAPLPSPFAVEAFHVLLLTAKNLLFPATASAGRTVSTSAGAKRLCSQQPPAATSRSLGHHYTKLRDDEPDRPVNLGISETLEPQNPPTNTLLQPVFHEQMPRDSVAARDGVTYSLSK